MKTETIGIFALGALVGILIGFVTGHRAALDNRSISHPRYGACSRCGRTWDTVSSHNTPYEWSTPLEIEKLGKNLPKEYVEYMTKPQPSRSCFPLCEQCWRELKTPEARLPFYRALLDNWIRDDFKQNGEKLWTDMKASVLAGN